MRRARDDRGAPPGCEPGARAARGPGLRAQPAAVPVLRSLPEWRTLEAHAASLADHELRALFAADPRRADRMHVDAAGWHLDYAKQRVNSETMRLLVLLAEARGWRG